MKKTYKTFLSRLEFILRDRKKHSWGKSMGLSHNMIHRIFEGNVPGWKELSAIMHKENVNPAWLAEGKSDPFFIAHCCKDEDFEMRIRHFFGKDQDWVVYLVTDDDALVVVLSRLKQYQYKTSHTANVSDIEVITGMLGDKTKAFIRSLAKDFPVFGLRISLKQMKLLRRGWVGNYELFGGSLNPGLLSHATAYVEPDDFFPSVKPKFSKKVVDSVYMDCIVGVVSDSMTEEGIRLDKTQFQRVAHDVYYYAKKKGINAENFDLSRVFD